MKVVFCKGRIEGLEWGGRADARSRLTAEAAKTYPDVADAKSRFAAEAAKTSPSAPEPPPHSSPPFLPPLKGVPVQNGALPAV